MTRTQVSPPHRTLALALEVSLFCALVLFTTHIAQSDLLQAQPALIASAIAFDLTLTAALCHWLLGIRLAGLQPWTTIPVLLAGLSLCRIILPKELTNAALPVAAAAIALLEASALTLATLKLRTILRSYRTAKQAGAETFDALETGVLTVAPKLPLLAAWARMEAQLWTLFLVGWTFKRTPQDGPNVFTHHKQSHWYTIISVITFLLLTEAAAAHLWLHSSGHMTAKWIVLAIHAYCLIWLIGDAQAARIYRSSLRTKQGQPTLDVRVGMRGSAEIPVSDIATITTGNWNEAKPDEALLALQGTANIRIELAKPTQIKPVLSTPKTVNTLLLHIDDPEAFKQALSSSLRPPEP